MTELSLLYFEDFPAGQVRRFGAAMVSLDAIEAFARRFDPPPPHADHTARAPFDFGPGVASGWHVAGMAMRMICDEILHRSAGLGSPGMQAIDWLHPVRAGDVLSMRASVISARESRSRPTTGLVDIQFDTLNQADAVVMRQRGAMFFRRRPEGAL